jgi:hypothetical protein
MGTGTGPSLLQPDPVPIPKRCWFMPPAGRCAQAICWFSQAAVLMVLISLAVMKAAPPP